MLQFHVLKYLKYDNIIKFSLSYKDAGYLCDANIDKDDSSQLLRYLMVIYTL